MHLRIFPLLTGSIPGTCASGRCLNDSKYLIFLKEKDNKKKSICDFNSLMLTIVHRMENYAERSNSDSICNLAMTSECIDYSR